MPERPAIDIIAAPGGWPEPWPNVAELADHLPKAHCRSPIRSPGRRAHTNYSGFA